MIAELIMVGTELLLGEVIDTNSAYLAERLAAIGVDLFYVTKVGDNQGRIARLVKEARQRADVVITSGGLGPTVDDLTKEAVAEAFELDLVLCAEALGAIEARFQCMQVPMSDNNRRQAYLPRGAKPLPNPKGTAPGVLLELADGKAIIMLPGVPVELEAIMEGSVIPYLAQRAAGDNGIIFSRVLRFYGLGESNLENLIKDLLVAQTNPTIAPYAGSGEVRVRITAKASSEAEATDLIAPVEGELLDRIGEYFYGYGDAGMESVVANLLLAQDKTIAIAESCTGGLVSNMLTNVPGSSGYYMQGAVTYSNLAKEAVLGLDSRLIEEYGAVSEQVARAMARGVRQWANTDIGIGITGIAGPGGGTDTKPVGLVYIGLSSAQGELVQRRVFNGDRLQVKERAALAALDMLRRHLIESKTEKV
ncbi:MAG: competence/damage-inducible protein A [Firmicutes bacterium]|nr:competence/damage-inducible protein A [Bacillota bacterium]